MIPNRAVSAHVVISEQGDTPRDLSGSFTLARDGMTATRAVGVDQRMLLQPRVQPASNRRWRVRAVLTGDGLTDGFELDHARPNERPHSGRPGRRPAVETVGLTAGLLADGRGEAAGELLRTVIGEDLGIDGEGVPGRFRANRQRRISSTVGPRPHASDLSNHAAKGPASRESCS